MDLKVYSTPTPRLGKLEEDFEAGLQSLSTIKAFFSDVLKGIDDLKEKLHIFNTLYRDKNINEFSDLKKLKGKVNKIIANKNYQNVMNIKVAGLAGLKSLSIAAEELPTAVNSVNEVTLKGLEEVEKILAEFIADVDFRKSFNFRYASVLGNLRDKKYDLNNRLSNFVDLNVIEDTVAIKDIIPNLQTLSIIYDKLYEAGEKTNTAELNTINKKVFDISEKVTIIEEILTTKSDTFSKTSVNALADLLSEYSAQLKSHSLVYYLTGEIIKIYLNIVGVVEESKL